MLHVHGANFHIVVWRGDIEESLRSASRSSTQRSPSSLSKQRTETPEDKRRDALYGSVGAWDSVKKVFSRIASAFRRAYDIRSPASTPLPEPPSDLFCVTPTSDPFDLEQGVDMQQTTAGCEELTFMDTLLDCYQQPPSRFSDSTLPSKLRRPMRSKFRERTRVGGRTQLRPIPESIELSFRSDRPYNMF
jgi:hypothetical protein